MVKRAIALGLALALGGTLAGCGGGEEGGGGGDTIQEDEGAIQQRPDMQNEGMQQQDEGTQENEGTERRGTTGND